MICRFALNQTDAFRCRVLVGQAEPGKVGELRFVGVAEELANVATQGLGSPIYDCYAVGKTKRSPRLPFVFLIDLA